MKLGICIYSSEPETIWSAFRLANISHEAGDTTTVFLISQGVEAEERTTEQFDIRGLMQKFIDAGGRISACTTCLRLRNAGETPLCNASGIRELYEMLTTYDKVISF
ncbi:MAG: DsrE family protein [Patescibacteria group bacterium]|jgi:uncharacterized protein involved in oxidation of intracellular sulfur